MNVAGRALPAARAYVAAGFSVIPLAPRSKRPTISKWEQYQERKPEDKETVDWFAETENNLGLVMGAISGNAFAIDFDDARLARFAFDLDKLAKKTFVQETAKGVHVVLRLEGGPVKSHNYRDRGLPLDIKGEGGYIVAAPSVHPEGAVYRMLSPEVRVGRIERRELDALLEDLAEEWPIVLATLPGYAEGRRHETDLGLAAWLRRRGFSKERSTRFVRRLCRVSEDPEVEDRIRAVEDTFAKADSEISVASLGPDLLATLDRLGKPPAEMVDGPQLFAEVKEALRAHYYMEEPWHYTIAALFILLSRVALSLPVVFYLFFGGAKGTGKTNALGLIAKLTNALSFENVSIAALARSMENGRTVCIDEYDVSRGREIDEPRDALVRQGYKHDAAPFVRWDAIRKTKEEIPIFGPKALTFRKDIDEAIQDRGFLIPTLKVRGKVAFDYVLNNFWPHLGNLANRLDEWGRLAMRTFPGSTLEAFARSPEFRAKVEAVLKELGANRATELVVVALLVAEMAGIDVLADLREANALREIASEASSSEEKEELLEVLADLTRAEVASRKEELFGDVRIVRVRQKEVFEEFNRRKRERGEKPIWRRSFVSVRREAGITEAWIRDNHGSLVWNLPVEWVKEWLLRPTDEIVKDQSESPQASWPPNIPPALDALGDSVLDAIEDRVKQIARWDPKRPDSWAANDIMLRFQLPEAMRKELEARLPDMRERGA